MVLFFFNFFNLTSCCRACITYVTSSYLPCKLWFSCIFKSISPFKIWFVSLYNSILFTRERNVFETSVPYPGKCWNKIESEKRKQVDINIRKINFEKKQGRKKIETKKIKSYLLKNSFCWNLLIVKNAFYLRCTCVPSKGCSIGRDGLKTDDSRLSPPLFFAPLALGWLVDTTELEPTLLLVSVLTVPESSCKITDSLCCWFAVKFIFSLFSLAFSIIVRTDVFISVSTATKCSPALYW